MIVYNNQQWTFRLLTYSKGSVIWKLQGAILYSLIISIVLSTRMDLVLSSIHIQHPFVLQVYMITLGYQVVIRIQMAMWRYWEGRSQLELMQARWLQSFQQIKAFCHASVAVVPGTVEEKESLYAEMSEYLNRLATYFTAMNGLALQTLQQNDAPKKTDAIERWASRGYAAGTAAAAKLVDSVGYGNFELLGFRSRFELLGKLTKVDVDLIGAAHDKVLLLAEWITEEVTVGAVRLKWLKTPPPMLSRSYQELSNGMLGYNQALKVALVPFPFVWAQVAAAALFLMLIFAPVVSLYFTRDRNLSILFTLCVVIGYMGLNAISVELEEPFGNDINDLPLMDIQCDFCTLVQQILCNDTPEGSNGVPGRLRGVHSHETRRKSALMSLDASVTVDPFGQEALFEPDETAPVEAMAPEVARINASLQEKHFTELFPGWLEPALLPQYTISDLKRKFKDADAALWVYRLIRAEFPDSLPPKVADDGFLRAELEEAEREQGELAARLAEVEAEIRELSDAKLTGVRADDEKQCSRWYSAQKSTSQEQEFKAEVSRLESENSRLLAELDVAMMRSRGVVLTEEMEEVADDIRELTMEKCRLERHIEAISANHAFETENIDRLVASNLAGQRELTERYTAEFNDLVAEYEAKLEAQREEHRLALDLAAAELEAEEEQSSGDRAKVVVSKLHSLMELFPGATLAGALRPPSPSEMGSSEGPLEAWQP